MMLIWPAMHFDLIQSVSLAGKPSTPNDDRIGCAERHTWVIDGATDLGEPGLLGDRGGAAWLAAKAHFHLSAASGSPAEICDTMFDGVANAYRKERRREPIANWEIPCAAFAMVAIDREELACAFASDCMVLHRGVAGVSFLTPPPNREIERAAASALGIGVSAMGTRSPMVLADRRASRSRPRSVLSIDPNEAKKATQILKMPVARGDDVLLMSDGFATLIEAYGIYEPATLINAMLEKGLSSLVDEIRVIEREDAGCVRFPRFKPSDDASAIWVRVA